MHSDANPHTFYVISNKKNLDLRNHYIGTEVLILQKLQKYVTECSKKYILKFLI